VNEKLESVWLKDGKKTKGKAIPVTGHEGS
jgi:hypothetical protein